MSERIKSTESTEPIKFSEKQRTELETRGFTIFELKGESIASLKASGVYFWSVWHDGILVEQIKSEPHEVAVNPKHLFLTDSESIEEYNHKISTEIPGVEAAKGSMADYIELEREYKEKTGRSLVRYGNQDVRITTSTPFDESTNLFVGELFDGHLVVSYRLGGPYSDIKVLPLITHKH